MSQEQTPNKHHGTIFLPILGALLIFALFPFFSPPAYFMSMLYMVFLYVVLAESWNIIGGFAGYLSFGHVAFFGIGAYTTAFLMNRMGLSPMATILSSIPAGFVAAMVAFLIGYPCLRLRGPYFAVVTMCFAFIIHMIIQNIGVFGGVEGLWLPAMKIPIGMIRAIFYEIMLGLMVLVVLLVRWIEKSKLGMGLATIKEDEEVAQTLGIHTPRLKILAFGLSAFFPGITGGIHAYYLTYISPEIVFDVMVSILIVLMTLFGGGGSWMGALIGAVSLSLVNEFLTTFVGAEIARIIYGFLFVVVIIFMPNGIMEFIRRRTNAVPRVPKVRSAWN
jgi:branched-chain amino acid transport system permease protein